MLAIQWLIIPFQPSAREEKDTGLAMAGIELLSEARCPVTHSRECIREMVAGRLHSALRSVKRSTSALSHDVAHCGCAAASGLPESLVCCVLA